MAITSVGYDGTVGETEWAIMAPRLGMPYWVADLDSLAMTIDKNKVLTVNIAGGQFGGVGVMDTSNATESVTFDPVATGNRYDLIVARRNWQGSGGATTFKVIKGGATRKVPAFNRNPGILDDQLLGLVQIQAGRTTPVAITDLRGFGLNSRVQILDPLAMEGYKNWPGIQAQVGREEYTLQVDRTWVRTGLISAVTPAYRMRLAKTKSFKYGGGLQSLGSGWAVSGDNTMGLQVMSNGKIKVTKAGIYSFSTNVYRYYGNKQAQGTLRFRMDGLWVKPTYEVHYNAGTNGIEQSLDWTGTLNVGDVVDFQFAHYMSDKSQRSWQFEIQIEMVA